MALKQHNIRLDEKHIIELRKRNINISAWIRKEIKKEYSKIIKEKKNGLS